MKQIIQLCTLICSCISSSILAYEPQILTTEERPPFHYVSDGVVVGSATQTLTCTLDKIDVPYVIKVMPWLRAQSEVKSGKASAFFSASQSDTRDEYAILSNPFVKQSWNWYVLKGSTLLPSASNFKSTARVAGIFGANASKWLEKNGYNLVDHKLDNLSKLVRLAELKRVDAIFGSSVLFDDFLKKNNKLDLFDVYVESEKSWGIYYSKDYLSKNKGFMDALNTTLASCQ
ncbi:transporter substrate-binding domain-containing protein [Vibrio sp. S4M6]|uniref:substrate-binding periplasmic protein n=1 Tax=Vibrio sinus TaxID=2946865 RepID=UPI002029F7EF|nr:transporter substrate-binding domain-containing protein [Vibrio sinus]MCL9781248.1 transporter substrate-binding domain-containing protein [Vibrio sinus]